MGQIFKNWNEQRKAYDAIHTVVLNQPCFHSMISSMRSCNQNTGPMTDTKRLKLVIMTGIEIGSLEDNNVKEWSFLRELWSVELGPVVVGVALVEEVEAEFNDEGGRDEESKRWGKGKIADEGEDNAELVDDDDPLHLDDVGDGRDEFDKPVMIFVAGPMSLLTWPFFPLIVSDPRRHVAPTDITYIQKYKCSIIYCCLLGLLANMDVYFGIIFSSGATFVDTPKILSAYLT